MILDPRTHGPDGRRRLRGLGLPVPGEPGPFNAITDVPGVSVGYRTLWDDTRFIRTGVTAVLPRPRADLLHPTWAGLFSMNGNGEMTGSHWVKEAGWFTAPITITNTLSLGMAHHGTVRWMIERFAAVGPDLWLLPIAAETYDGWLNDIAGLHVTEADVAAAIDAATGGPLAEGNVGGGAGMIAYEFKGGTGTASRQVVTGGGRFTVGALVQANHGRRPWLTVCGVPVGEAMPEGAFRQKETGSIIVIIATDAPLMPNQLERLARRASIGIGRAGTPSSNSSGDIFLAFSTANDPGPLPEPPRLSLTALGSDQLDPLFMAVVESVDEAILNAMLAAQTTLGPKGRRVEAIDPDRLAELVLKERG